MPKLKPYKDEASSIKIRDWHSFCIQTLVRGEKEIMDWSLLDSSFWKLSLGLLLLVLLRKVSRRLVIVKGTMLSAKMSIPRKHRS